MIAIVRGSLSVMVVPFPFVLSISIDPCRASMPRLTTSMPTPRPDTLVTSFAVEKPGARIRAKSSRSGRMASAEIMPRSTALARMASLSSPAPSSAIFSRTLAPACSADRCTVPQGGLPFARRTSGLSIP